MIKLIDLTICKKCGNVFSQKIGIEINPECPLCKADNTNN